MSSLDTGIWPIVHELSSFQRVGLRSYEKAIGYTPTSNVPMPPVDMSCLSSYLFTFLFYYKIVLSFPSYS